MVPPLVEIGSLWSTNEQRKAFADYQALHLEEFLERLKSHPLSAHRKEYVSRSEAFWLYRFAIEIQAQTIVESGTMHGYSAWWLNQGSPTSRLITFDPTCNPNNAVANALVNWRHMPADFANTRLIKKYEKTFAFFDDHTSQAKRLQQGFDKGIRHFCFHDVVGESDLLDAPLLIEQPSLVFHLPEIEALMGNNQDFKNLTFIMIGSGE